MTKQHSESSHLTPYVANLIPPDCYRDSTTSHAVALHTKELPGIIVPVNHGFLGGIPAPVHRPDRRLQSCTAKAQRRTYIRQSCSRRRRTRRLCQRGISHSQSALASKFPSPQLLILMCWLQKSHITSLHKELRDVRQAYLSTAQPRRTPGRTAHGPPQVLTDREREDVDVNAKQMIRELNASIRGLEDAEQLRRETESALIRKKYASGFSALSSWASGGSIASRSPEHAAAEAQAQQTDMHRDGILWYLRQRLELCCRTQQDMMETRLTREVEKSRGMLSPPVGDFVPFPPVSKQAFMAAAISEDPALAGETATQASAFTQGLTEEQLQMFEEGNQDMMQHYESTLDKVRYVPSPTILFSRRFSPCLVLLT